VRAICGCGQSSTACTLAASIRRNYVAQEGHSALVEGTLGSLDEEGIFLQLGEDKVEVVEVFRPRRAEN
jgi:hypothetical protein